MTMNISRGEVIAGVSAWDLREFFLQLRSWHRERFSSSELEKHFAPGKINGLDIGQKLVSEGYVQVVEPDDYERDATEENACRWYELTDRGISLANASAAGRIKRSTSERVLAEFMDRVQYVDRKGSGYLYKVTAVVVYGSFLTEKDTLGDVDLAVELTPLYPDPQEQSNHQGERIRSASKRGRGFPNIVERLY